MVLPLYPVWLEIFCNTTDLSAKNGGGGAWVIDYSANSFAAFDVVLAGYGLAESRPAPADYDGDGRADFAVKMDDGRWLIDYAWNGFGAFDQTVFLQ